MAQDQQMFRRAANAAIVGLVVQLIFTVVMGILAVYTGGFAFNVAAWAFIGGLPIWIILILVYHQHRVERIEALEAEQLARADATTAAIFDEHGVDLQVSRRRLNFLYKWGLGGVSLFEGVFLLATGVFWLAYFDHMYNLYRPASPKDINPVFTAAIQDSTNAGVLLAIIVAICLVAFLVARYEAGMAKVSQWQLLRGGAAYLMGNLFLSMLMAIGLVAHLMGSKQVLVYLGLAFPFIVMILGAEMLLTFLLSAYRPRRPGEITRPAFDSRILGMFTSPKSMAKALSDAINYQFGFEVSRSWFYQLLGQAITPLVAFSVVVLVLMSTIVIVAPQQEALILKNGAIQGEGTVGPGLHFKWPWPVGSVQIEDVGRLQEFSMGSAGTNGLDDSRAILWTNSHAAGDAKEHYLVAAPTPLDNTTTEELTNPDAEDQNRTAAIKERAPGISLVGLQVQVQYRIRDLRQYVAAADDVRQLLLRSAERQLNAYLVTQDIDSLIGPARMTAGEILRTRIQEDADRNKLGVQVVFVGLVGVHPPSDGDVAAAFQQQIEVLQQSQTKIEQANQIKIMLLASVAGSLRQADEITAAIKNLEATERDMEKLHQGHAGPDKLAAKQKDIAVEEADIEELLASAQGQAAEKIYKARAYRWEKDNQERAKSERFEAELAAFQRAPELYRMRRYLEVLTQAGWPTRASTCSTPHSGLAHTLRALGS